MAASDDLRVTVYTPDSALASPSKMLLAMFSDLVAGRELAWRLAVRDLSAQYRQTLLGFLWALILPLANTVVWIFLSSSGVVKLADTGIPYPVYVFVGTMLWAVLMDAVNAPLQGTTAAKPMLAKINFPREAIIVSGVYQTLFNAIIKIALILSAVIWFGITPGWEGLMIPFGVLSLVLVGTAIGLMVTPIGLLYQDIGRGLPLLLQFLMYTTPVVFAMPKEGIAATLFQYNPLTPAIETTRAWLTGQPTEMLGYFLIVNLTVALFLLVVWVIYRLAMPILVERMSA
jgi:lipopolysaccharide transport system permease protein